MKIKELNKNNLHHAYLIEGAREEIVPEVLAFCEDLNIKTLGNPDFCRISMDNFKIDDAFNLRAMSGERGFSSAPKIFMLCANSLSLDAQNVLLKMFEEPVGSTVFFLIVPDVQALLKTLVSRFYFIKWKTGLGGELKDAEKFVAMPLSNRINFIKELLAETEEENEEEGGIVALDSARFKALNFLNALEFVLHRKFLKNFSGLTSPGAPGRAPAVQNFSETCFEHFFKVRRFLRMPGSSTKNLMESTAIIIPDL